MRGYALSHFLLMPLQKGLQSHHAVSRVRSSDQNGGLQSIYDDWEKNHTTLIYLNGGFSRELKDAYDMLVRLDPSKSNQFMFPVPWADFREDEDTMEGMRTAVGLIVHPRYYAAFSCVRNNPDFFLNYAKLVKLDLSRTLTGIVFSLQQTMKYEKIQVADICFENYSEAEIEFITYMSKFSLAN